MPRPLARLLRILAATAAATLTAGLLSAPAHAAAGTGSVVGSLRNGDTPVPAATVALQLSAYQVTLLSTVTDAGGAFHFDKVPAGTYKVKFTMLGGLTQFHPGQTDFAAATVITVTDHQAGTVDEAVIPHGALRGRVTTATGSPAAHALVGITAAASTGIEVSRVLTDDNGDYLLPYVAAGSYREFVSAAERSAPRQWVHSHKSATDADPVPVAAGPSTVVDERLLPLGTVTGRYSNAAGPVAGSVVGANSLADPAETVFANTAADGTFHLQAYPGTYKVEFQAPGAGLDQWANQKESKRRADPVTLAAGAEIVLDEHAIPTGTVSGHLTDAAGRPVADASVLLSDAPHDRFFEATTGADGAWSLTAWTGTYQLHYTTGTQIQWARGADSPATAAPVAVATGQTTVVDEALAAPGSLTVTAVQAGTGAALSSFCATAHTAYVYLGETCTENGTVTWPRAGAGRYTVTVKDSTHADSVTTGVRVAAGGAGRLTARLVTAATIHISIVDADTGTPIETACVDAVQATRAPTPGEGVGDCTYDGTGTLTLSRVRPEPYALFASVLDGVHGGQWVGPHGGVGAEAAARIVDPAPGSTTDLTIRLDRAGTVTGTVTDQATGAPVEGALVDAVVTGASTDKAGHYTVDNLGPYRWTLFASHADYAGEWTGGGNNRFAATTIPVRAGQTSTYNVALDKGSTVTGTVAGMTGAVPDSASVTVLNAHTFDEVARVTAGPDGSYTAHVLGHQEVKLLVEATFRGCSSSRWYGDAVDFAHTRTFSVPARGGITADIVIADECAL